MPQSLAFLKLPSSTGRGPREVPVLTFTAPKAGPTVAVTANVHGDEATGVGVVHELAGRLERLLLRGTVHLYPSLNPEGLIQRSRTVPADGRDLNRVWPGDARGGPAERLAHVLWGDLCARHPDLLIDVHADAPASIPYAIIDRVVRGSARKRKSLEKKTAELAGATGLTVLHEYPHERYLKYHLDQSLSGAVANELNIPAVTIESGPRLYLDPGAIDVATQAALGVLTELGVCRRPAERHSTRLPDGPWRRESGPRVSQAGVFHALVRPGQPFEAKEPMAEVKTLEGRTLERIDARQSGFVVSLPERTWVVPGVAAGTYAISDA